MAGDRCGPPHGGPHGEQQLRSAFETWGPETGGGCPWLAHGWAVGPLNPLVHIQILAVCKMVGSSFSTQADVASGHALFAQDGQADGLEAVIRELATSQSAAGRQLNSILAGF